MLTEDEYATTLSAANGLIQVLRKENERLSQALQKAKEELKWMEERIRLRPSEALDYGRKRILSVLDEINQIKDGKA